MYAANFDAFSIFIWAQSNQSFELVSKIEFEGCLTNRLLLSKWDYLLDCVVLVFRNYYCINYIVSSQCDCKKPQFAIKNWNLQFNGNELKCHFKHRSIETNMCKSISYFCGHKF